MVARTIISLWRALVSVLSKFCVHLCGHETPSHPVSLHVSNGESTDVFAAQGLSGGYLNIDAMVSHGSQFIISSLLAQIFVQRLSGVAVVLYLLRFPLLMLMQLAAYVHDLFFLIRRVRCAMTNVRHQTTSACTTLEVTFPQLTAMSMVMTFCIATCGPLGDQIPCRTKTLIVPIFTHGQFTHR